MEDSRTKTSSSQPSEAHRTIRTASGGNSSWPLSPSKSARLELEVQRLRKSLSKGEIQPLGRETVAHIPDYGPEADAGASRQSSIPLSETSTLLDKKALPAIPSEALPDTKAQKTLLSGSRIVKSYQQSRPPKEPEVEVSAEKILGPPPMQQPSYGDDSQPSSVTLPTGEIKTLESKLSYLVSQLQLRQAESKQILDTTSHKAMLADSRAANLEISNSRLQRKINASILELNILAARMAEIERTIKYLESGSYSKDEHTALTQELQHTIMDWWVSHDRVTELLKDA